MKKKIKEIDLNRILKGKRVPILILDKRWHDIFPESEKTGKLKEIEEKLSSLLKRQGKLVNEMKDMKKLKKKFMHDIINHMDVDDSKIGLLKSKKLNQNQRLINGINEKMKLYEDEIIELPYQIKQVNEELIIKSAELCYEQLKNEKKKMKDLDNSILKLRDELKVKILEKQDLEIKNNAIYSYMHDLLGPELLQNLDERFVDE